MSYNPIIIKDDIRQRPRQVVTHYDFNDLANSIIAQINNITKEVSEVFIRVDSCKNSLEDLQIILQRQIDSIIAGVMPDNSISYGKFITELKVQLDLVNTQLTVLNTLNTQLTNIVNQYNSLRAINNADIANLKGV